MQPKAEIGAASRPRIDPATVRTPLQDDAYYQGKNEHGDDCRNCIVIRSVVTGQASAPWPRRLRARLPRSKLNDVNGAATTLTSFFTSLKYEYVQDLNRLTSSQAWSTYKYVHDFYEHVQDLENKYANMYII